MSSPCDTCGLGLSGRCPGKRTLAHCDSCGPYAAYVARQELAREIVQLVKDHESMRPAEFGERYGSEWVSSFWDFAEGLEAWLGEKGVL